VKSKCKCREVNFSNVYSFENIHTIFHQGGYGSSSYWGIKKCRECGQLYEVTSEFNDGTGRDYGQKPITQTEANQLIKEHPNV